MAWQLHGLDMSARTWRQTPWLDTADTGHRAQTVAARWLRSADIACRGPPEARAGRTCEQPGLRAQCFHHSTLQRWYLGHTAGHL